MKKRLSWVDNNKGKHVGVRVTYGDGTSDVFGLKAPGFLGMFGDSIRKRLSIDWGNLRTKRVINKIKSIVWRG